MDVSGLDESATDEAIAAVARNQYEDWRELRLEDADSPPYRRGVHRLATRLVEITTAIADRPVVTPEERVIGPADGVTESGEELGAIDRLALFEEALPRWTETMESIGPVLEKVGERTQKAAAEIERRDAAGKGFAGRLAVARELARDLDEPANELVKLGTSYASDLLEVDQGVLTWIDLIADQGLHDDEDPPSRV